MKALLEQYLFWIVLVLSAISASILTVYYFPQSNPLIHLNITMNRYQAIEKSNQIARQFALGPTDAFHAASFHTDEQVKTFVELEQKRGKDGIVAIMDNNLYQPYTWVVRLFKPFEPHELILLFTPDGTPYGFKEIISENSFESNLSQEEALAQANTFVQQGPWNIALDAYALIEQSQKTSISGRINHIFTYERMNEKIGDAVFRLNIVVSGHHVSELAHSVKVPDSFIQYYKQIRSTNDSIAYAATIIMLLIYVIGCCGIGLFTLAKHDYIIWNIPLYIGACIAGLVTLNIPNQLPLAWMHYSTAHSPITFLFQQGITALYSFIFLLIAFTLIFTAAESLSRCAFGHHLQLWRVYSPQAAGTYTVLSYTLIGYLTVPIMICYTTLFYAFTRYYFEWWNPSSALSDPNILASYFPWLESISESLYAGSLEECLFRAIPLASAALLGNRFGKRTWWIAGAFIIQALIFGAAHANYPAQPAYARIVELFVDSALFGAIYLWIGLLPTIITHFIYDVFCFALPIFASTAPGALLNKIIIIVLGLVPLGIVLFARLKQNSWKTIAASLLNKAWKAPIKKNTPHPILPPSQQQSIRKKVHYLICFFGIIGLIFWVICTQFSADAPSFTISRAAAHERGNTILHNKNILFEQWYPLIDPLITYEHSLKMQQQHRFVWQTGGKDIYHQLLSSYLTPPCWINRYVKFNGPLIERTEEHVIFLTSHGSLFQYIHKLPETTPGATLSSQEAQTLAHAAAEQLFHIKPEQFRLISSVATKQPARLDWAITYCIDTEPKLTQGELRVTVKIAGNEVVDVYRFVHVPETWARAEENRLVLAYNINQVCKLIVLLIILIAAMVALVQWRTSFVHSALWLFGVLSSMFLFELFNSWPTILAHFNTSQPFYHQIFRSFTIQAIQLILRAAALTIAFCFVTNAWRKYQQPSFLKTLIYGINLGLLLLGIESAMISITPSMEPTWANYTPLRFLIPFTAGINSIILHYLSLTILCLLWVSFLNKITHYGSQRHIHNFTMNILGGYLGASLLFADNIPLFLLSGILFGTFFYIGYLLILRFDYAVIPIISATYLIGENVQQWYFNSYLQAPLIISIASGIIALGAWTWSKQLRNIAH